MGFFYRPTPLHFGAFNAKRCKMKRLIVFALAGMLLATGCSNVDGQSVQSLRAAAGIVATPQASPPTAPPPQPTETAQPQPAQILPTETPDIEPQAEPQSFTQPAQVIETATAVVVLATVTPQPAAAPQVPTCDPNVPQPTIALDGSDRAAGVVLRGQTCPQVWQVQP
jgi:hypothetical protein